MAIAFDNATAAASGASVSSLTFSYTVGSGLQNSLLLVGAEYYSVGFLAVTSITYNAVNLALIQRNNNGSAAATVEVWGLANPASGAHNVIITLAGTIAGNIIGTARSYQNCPQTSFVDSQSTTPNVVTGTHSSQSTSVTTVAPNTWLVDFLAEQNTAPTAGGSQANAVSANGGSTWGASSDRGPILVPASTAMSWTFTSTSTASAQSVVGISPIAGGWLVGGLLVGGRGCAVGGQ